MANYATLKAAITAAIKQNGNNEITGTLLQQQLLAMVNSLGVGYQFAGVATSETQPGTPDQNVFYCALPGTYPNFGGTTVPTGSVGLFMYNGTWTYLVIEIASGESLSFITDLENGLPVSVDFNRGYGTIDGNNIATGNDGYYKIKIKMPDSLQTNNIIASFGSNNDWYIQLEQSRIIFGYLDGNGTRQKMVLSYDYSDLLGKDIEIFVQIDTRNGVQYLGAGINGVVASLVQSWTAPTISGKYTIGALYSGLFICPMRFYYLDVYDKGANVRYFYTAQNVQYVGGVPVIYVANREMPGIEQIKENEQFAKSVPFLRMNGANSALIYNNRSSIVLTSGEIEMKLRLPDNVQNNQMLFAFGNALMCNINGGSINVYNTASHPVANIAAYAGQVITLRMKKVVTGTSVSLTTFINGVNVSAITFTQTAAADNTTLSIGSYEGTALFATIDFYYFAKYDANGLIEYVITPETIADTNFANELFVGNINLSQQQSSGANLDALPSTLYLTVGKQYNIYMENVVLGFTESGMYLCVAGSGVKTIEAQNRNVRLNITTAGTYSTIWNLYAANGTLLATKNVTLIVSSATAGSGTKQFLFVGDSTIDNAVPGVYAHEGPEIVREFYTLCDNNKGFTTLLLGKQTFVDGGITYRHEGHAGMSSSWFIGSSSPFYYGGAINFASYMADVYPLTPGASNAIDFMVYQIGLNDLKTGGTAASVIANIKTLITALFASYPNAKVIIGMPPTGCDATGWAAHFNGNVTTLAEYVPFRKRMMEYLKAIVAEFDNGAYNANVFVCNGGEMIDRVFGFPYEDLPVSSRVSATEMTHTDSMHPNKDGYDQIADGYFGRIKSLV